MASLFVEHPSLLMNHHDVIELETKKCYKMRSASILIIIYLSDGFDWNGGKRISKLWIGRLYYEDHNLAKLGMENCDHYFCHPHPALTVNFHPSLVH
jgi:hypothetical protein